ncbi:hypothetical protein Bca52824_053055 [Brassica carinata]|nr:hypothetical protein Bca52824_053055 [Brassica carinata]
MSLLLTLRMSIPHQLRLLTILILLSLLLLQAWRYLFLTLSSLIQLIQTRIIFIHSRQSRYFRTCSPILESAQKLSSITTPIANTISTVQRDGSRTAEPDFGSNKFALLFKRPVKPSTKAKEMHWHSTCRGRGNRGRGNRGGRV